MATGTLRFAIIVALVAGGILLIARFPQGSTALPAASPSSPATQPPAGGGQTGGAGEQTNAGGGQTTGGEEQQTPSPQIQGVRLAVYNGTYVAGLAAAGADALGQLGYKINPDTSILDADAKPWEQTTLFYVARSDKIEAEALANDFFKDLDVKIQKLPADSQAPDRVQVAVYLGTDYADASG